jgi:hypothetical protein
MSKAYRKIKRQRAYVYFQRQLYRKINNQHNATACYLLSTKSIMNSRVRSCYGSSLLFLVMILVQCLHTGRSFHVRQISVAPKRFAFSVPRQQLQQPHTVSSCPRTLHAATDDLYDNNNNDDDTPVGFYRNTDAIIEAASRSLQRTSWFSWWSQVILTAVSSVTLVFAKNASAMASSKSSLVMSGPGLVLSCVSIVWTWGNSRLARRMLSKATGRVQAAAMLRRAIRVGCTLNMIGLVFNLIAAEQIVGGLAIKVLTNRQTLALGTSLALESLQPLDILVVQANTNSLLSHFCSLASLLFLTKQVSILDPPSVEGDERRR